MKTRAILSGLLITMLLHTPFSFAQTAKATVTVLVASNQGTEFDLDNDAFKDQLIKLFSYTSYHQVSAQAIQLAGAEGAKMDLPEGYQLLLNIQGEEEGRLLVKAVIQKDGTNYVDTVLSVLKEGIVCLGGPQVSGGDLVIVLEMSF